MKNLQLLFAALILVFCSCGKDDEMQLSTEITTIQDVDHTIFTEILRLNILTEYGGAFRQMQLYHSEAMEIGMPCDSTFMRDLIEDNSPSYSLNIPVEVTSQCEGSFTLGYNTMYSAWLRDGVQTASSDVLSIESKLEGQYKLIGHVDDDEYVYNQSVTSSLLITSGISAELDPRAHMHVQFLTAHFDQENVEMTEETEATFGLEVFTNEAPNENEKVIRGTIKLIDGEWTVTYDDGVVHLL